MGQVLHPLNEALKVYVLVRWTIATKIIWWSNDYCISIMKFDIRKAMVIKERKCDVEIL